MFTQLPLKRHEPTKAISAAGHFVEALERRCLLSAAPAAILADIAGKTFNGTIHLKFHATATAPAHSQALPVSMTFNPVVNGMLSGTESGGGRSTDAAFNGPVQRRTFHDVFIDGTGTISGRFGPQRTRLVGKVSETIDGQVVTGKFRLTDLVAKATQTETSAQNTETSTPLNFMAGAGTTINAISPATAGGATAPAASSTNAGPTVAISLPALGTSFVTSDALNGNTTAAGANNADLTAGAATSGNNQVAGLPANTTTNFSFSSSSGAISIFNSGPQFSASSGLTSVSSTPTFSAGSGIVSVFSPGM